MGTAVASPPQSLGKPDTKSPSRLLCPYPTVAETGRQVSSVGCLFLKNRPKCLLASGQSQDCQLPRGLSLAAVGTISTSRRAPLGVPHLRCLFTSDSPFLGEAATLPGVSPSTQAQPTSSLWVICRGDP